MLLICCNSLLLQVNITSTLGNSWGTVSPQNSSELPSIGTYFAEGSDKLGELSTKLSPSERVSITIGYINSNMTSLLLIAPFL